LQLNKRSGEFSFEVACRPTHRGVQRQTAIRIASRGSDDASTDEPCYRAVLPVYSHDVAPLRIAPLSPVFERQVANEALWSGYVILTGDLIEQGMRPKTITAPHCEVEFTMVELGTAAQRVNITLRGPVETLATQQQKLNLTLDNGLRQSLDFRLRDH
jgi:hypothetical protein